MFGRHKTDFLLATALVLLFESAGSASIILPPQPTFDFEAISVDESGCSSHPKSDTDVPQVPGGEERELLACPAPVDGSTGGMSSPAGSSGTGGVSCAVCSAAIIQPDGSFSQMVGELSLAVPDPPGFTLIRPPQRQV